LLFSRNVLVLMRRQAYVTAARAVLDTLQRTPEDAPEQLELAKTLRDLANGLLCELVIAEISEENLELIGSGGPN
jgi:hypothetical protein